MQDLSPSEVTAIAVEAALLLCGLFALWKLQFSPAARQVLKTQGDGPLEPWAAGIQDIAILLFFVICGGLAGQIISLFLLDTFKAGAITKAVIGGASFQVGMLIGVTLFVKVQPAGKDFSLPKLPFIKQGSIAFLAILPLIMAVGAVTSVILHQLDIVLPRQELVDIFRNADDPFLIVLLTFLAVVVAPITEELIFRAGLFRFLRTRTPRWVAFLLPALLFGALHGNLATFPQLVVLGLLFSIAYERTGNIAVSILAHALFNLNSILLIISGIDA